MALAFEFGNDLPVRGFYLPCNISLDIERFATSSENLLKSAHGPLYVSVKPVEAEGASGGKLILIHDMSFVERRSEETKKYLFYFFVGLGFTVSLIIVNPYDVDQCAAALHLALSMPESEQRDRMRLMRGLIQEFNVYRWAGRMLIDAAVIRRRGRLREQTSNTVT